MWISETGSKGWMGMLVVVRFSLSLLIYLPSVVTDSFNFCTFSRK